MNQERNYLVTVGDNETGEVFYIKEELNKESIETALLVGYEVIFHNKEQENDFKKIIELVKSIACSVVDDEVVTCPYCYEELEKGSINYYEGYHVDGCDDYGVHY